MWLYSIFRGLSGLFVKIFWLDKCSGLENVPKTGGVIIAPNHQSWIDVLFLMTTLRDRRLYFLAGEFVYRNKLAAWAMNVMGHVRVDRYSEDKRIVYDQAKEILTSGGALVVFPEGRLSKDGRIQRGYKGAAKMALENKVDIVPTVISNSFDIYPYHQRFPRLKKCCEVKYLKRIKYEDFKKLSPETIVHDLIMKKIAAELGHEYDYKGFVKDLKAC